jgi:tetratricopeptide (TPR) repeat protein
MPSRSPLLARLAGDPLRAGDLYYQQGKLTQAAAMYRSAKRFDQAAKVYLEMGDRAAALALFLEGNDHLRAGEMMAQDGDHRAAVRHFELAKAWGLAAESSLQLKQPEKAARFFERAGAMARAAACYEKAGELDEALRVLEREARSVSGRIRITADESLKEQLRQLDATRATLLARAGRGAEAADLLLLQGSPARAAELLERAGDADRAVRAWLEAGKPDRALPLLSRATGIGPAIRADVLRQCLRFAEAAEAYAEAGRPAEAADAWEAAGDWARAAPLWESNGEMERAGELYARAEEWRAAARCYSAAGRLELAAEAYSQLHDEASAAVCYLEVGRYMKAARAFLAAGDKEAAGRALQQIAETSPDFERATLMLVPLLVEDGLAEGALHRLELLPQDPTTTGSGAVERQYWEARALEGMGRVAEAARAYQRTVALRRDHRDAGERLERLRALIDSGTLALSLQGDDSGRRPAVAATAVSAAPPGELRPGTVLADRYELLAEVGAGGMGRVYKARDRELGDVVAVKTLLSAAAWTAGDQDRLLREVQICRRITHPNVVRVYDIGRFAGGLFVTMEYLEGKTLDQEMRASGQLPLAQVRDLLQQLLSGLEEAHQLRIVHRDLKPSNVVVAGGRAKILDFGIARAEGGDTSLTMPGEVLGSPKYMSPEQIQGEELDGRSDLYALGILTYTMLAGQEPFTGRTPSAIALKQLHEAPPPIEGLRPDLPAAWHDLLDHLLAKSRDARFAGATQALAVVRTLPV